MKEKIKIGIVEDEIIIAKTIALYLTEIGYIVSFVANTFKSALSYLENCDTDLLLLDINLKSEKNGIELSELIKHQYQLPFIFLTANSDSYTIEQAKEKSPLAFILKPFTKDILFSTIEIAMNNYSHFTNNKTSTNEVVYIKHGKKKKKIIINEICYIENDHIYLVIVLKDGSREITRSSFSDFLQKLPQNLFVQVSRSHIINLEYVHEIGKNYVIVNNEKINFSVENKKVLLNRLQLNEENV